MLFHQVTSNNPLEIFLNLEELICLSSITEQIACVWPNDVAEKYCDLAPFNIQRSFPENIIEFDISDYVCMYNHDLSDLEGREFLSYRSKQQKQYTRLDKFKMNDFLIKFSKPNYYESKYYTSNKEIRKTAYRKALRYNISEAFRAEFEFFSHMLPNMPIVCNKTQTEIDIPEQDYFYTYEINKPSSNNGLDLNAYFSNYSESIKEINKDMLILAISKNFTEVYGEPNDYLFGALSKLKFIENPYWSPKLTTSPVGGIVSKYELKDVEPWGYFDFSKKNLNIERSKIMSTLRFRDCVVDNV